MLMTPGIAFFYAGLAGEEMASNTMMMAFVSMAIVSIQFWAFGYSVCFSSDGLFAWAGCNNVGAVASGVCGGRVPHILFAFFQTQIAVVTPALLSGGIVGRMKFGTFMLFVLLWSSLVYDPLAHWMWSRELNKNWEVTPMGWEGKMDSRFCWSGAVSGLVTITPGCAFVYPWAAVIFGVVGAATGFGAVHLKNYLRYDNALDSRQPAIEGGAIYGHGMQFVHQLMSQCVAAGYSAVVTFLILMVLKHTIGLRISEDKEVDGMDVSYHEGLAYELTTHSLSSSSSNYNEIHAPQRGFSKIMISVQSDSTVPCSKEPIMNVSLTHDIYEHFWSCTNV
ncbi:unnamed protein product [Peronospora destructor]|uniref:Ammonium transporter AmtB-like domain-containing protein n=1 Tax=Peronospora destructor TaxID=86335 RepID=A0AAV0SYH4_9STRA|nr:unnamed protein product [Peronospora destructor]